MTTKSKILLAALLAVFSIGVAQADLSVLVVKVSPVADQYTVGSVIKVSALGNGLKRQTNFILERVTGAGDIPVTQQYWSALTTYQVNTAAMVPGEYRLTVQSRETGRREVLSKTQFLRLVAPAVAACDLINGGTYTNATAVAKSIDLGCPGLLCSGLTSILQAGFSLTTLADAANLASVSFASGQISVMPANVSLTSGMGGGTVQASALLAGNYSCSGNTVTFSATGSGSLSGSSGLLSLLGSASVPLGASGTLLINPATNTLSAGAALFQ